MGPLYSLGLSKGIKEYDPDNFDHDKKVAEKVSEILKKRQRNDPIDGDLDIEDEIEDMNLENEIEMDIAVDMNQTDDYNDGDPWGKN